MSTHHSAQSSVLSPQSSPDKPARVRTMFGKIVPRYDLMNTIMTGGMDRGWRRVAVRLSEPRDTLALDIATGTAELAIEMVSQGARKVVGLDFCGPMLDEGARKTAGLKDRVPLAAGDAQALPFPDGTFDRAINGFLLRNVADLPLTLREMYRVLRPGGRLVCLEITHPPSRLFSPFFKLFFYGVVPRIGALISGQGSAYTYLPNSLTHFPAAPRLAEMLKEAGFSRVRYRYLGFGTVAVHVADKTDGFERGTPW